ncbi:MAG TPA: LamG domain-containing protein [Nostocaceae cyanobacterium]|nr:LamG domain-containing protein [Nostocaceae cyanobacterium]
MKKILTKLAFATAGIALSIGMIDGQPVQASSLYASRVLADNPLAYWRLGETSGNIAYDSSGNGNHGTYYGGVTLGVSGGIIDNNTAANFDGVNDYIQTPLNSNLRNLTIETWFKSDVNTGEHSIVDSDIAFRFGQSLILGYGNGDNTLDVQYHNGAYNSPFQVAIGEWYHAVAVFTTNQVSLYVNGNFIGSQTHSVQPLDGSNFRIGRHNNDNPNWNDPQWFDGTIDEVAIYGYALSSAQIKSHYEAGFTSVPEPNMLLGLLAFGGFLASKNIQQQKFRDK